MNDREEKEKDVGYIIEQLNKRRLAPCGFCKRDKCVPLPADCEYDDFVINNAIRAIQEREECNKGCKFCCTEYSVDEWRTGKPHEFRVEYSGLFDYTTQYGWEGIQINYCPMCGRALKGKAK